MKIKDLIKVLQKIEDKDQTVVLEWSDSYDNWSWEYEEYLDKNGWEDCETIEKCFLLNR